MPSPTVNAHWLKDHTWTEEDCVAEVRNDNINQEVRQLKLKSGPEVLRGQYR